MFTVPNVLSLCRIPLAFCFLQESPLIRSLAIILALISDGLDGYLARRYRQESQLGTILDPLTDKFFVLFATIILVGEGRLNLLEVGLLICRDFSVAFFACYLLWKKNLTHYRVRAIWCGKVTTVCQFIVLFCLVYSIPIPVAGFTLFALLGILALLELYLTSASHKISREESNPMR